MLSAFHSILTKTDVEFRERTSRDYRDRTSLFKDKTLVVTGKRRILSREHSVCQTWGLSQSIISLLCCNLVLNCAGKDAASVGDWHQLLTRLGATVYEASKGRLDARMKKVDAVVTATGEFPKRCGSFPSSNK